MPTTFLHGGLGAAAIGLLIGSGMIESSGGALVAARFKRGGMH